MGSSRNSYNFWSNYIRWRRKTLNQLEYYLSNKDDFTVKKHSEKDLYIIKYKHPQVDWSNEYTLQARGIVLDGEGNIVARPYPKFFNLGELRGRDDLDRKTRRLSEWNSDKYEVLEKLDGSLVTVFSHEDELMFASSGNLEGEFPNKFKSWFDKNLIKAQKKYLLGLTENYTLMFEYISPDNRVVVPYNKTEMVLHGILDTKNVGGEITDSKVLEVVSNELGVSLANNFGRLEKESVLNLQKQDYSDNLFEGFVIRFENGKRIKIKTDTYVSVHGEHTIGMGRIDSKRMIEEYISRIDNDTIDDLIALMEQRGDSEVIKVINKVMDKSYAFRNMVKEAESITNDESFNKKEWVMQRGSEDWFSKVVLNINNRSKIDKIRVNFILEKFKES